MSINVTVNGKPISLTKTGGGRMVACEQDSEFDRRRKIRLQQVRQQSKEIAAEVRNRVKQEKSKQFSNIEHQTEKDLRKFQEKKLQTLNKHYEDCNREIGAAHKNAAIEKDPAEVLNEISKKNDKSAHARLKIAVENKAKEELQRQNKLELLEKQRKYTKEIEKTRANLVVAINKQHSPPKININRSSKKRRKKNETTLNDTFNSDIENVSSPTFLRRSRSPIKSKPKKKSITKENLIKSPPKTKQQKPEIRKQTKKIFDQEAHSIVWEENSKIDLTSNKENTETNPKVDIKSSGEEVKSPQKENKCSACLEKNKSEISYSKPVISSSNDDFICDNDTCPYFVPLLHDRAIFHPASPPLTPTKCGSQFSSSSSVRKELSKDEIKKLIDEHQPDDICRARDTYLSTKISDRIRQRSDQLNQDIALDLESINIAPEHKRKTTNLCETRKLQMKNIPIVDIPSVQENPKLPFVPQTSLKSKIAITKIPQQQTTRAKYYDHSKHFSKKYVPSASVQKLDRDCVEVNTSIESTENEKFRKNMCTQDQRAKIRGDKALKKTQIQNDYKQLMEELPVLQRQERLAAMRNHNPEFHMTDERLHELERRRQNRIENIFEKYYHKSKTLETPIVTIRPVQKPAPDDEMKLPFTALDVSEELQPFNVAHWKSENRSQTSKSLRFESQHSNRKTASTSRSKFQFQELPESPQDTLSDEECRQKCLAELLQRLNKQRELLLKEVENLPPSSNLQKILLDETPSHLTNDSHHLAAKPKFVSASTSPISSDSKKTKNAKKRQGVVTSSDSAEEKQKKRQKPKEKKLKVLKNDEGTQTSPKISSPKEKLFSKSKKSIPQEQQQTKNNDVDVDDDKLCEIIIKMCDDSKVKICTQPITSLDSKYEEKVVFPSPKPINCDISSSTSYLSPPIVIDQNEKYKTDYKDILYGKPKQTNIDSFPKREHHKDKEEKTDHIKRHSISKQKNIKSHTPTKLINPQLLNYIKKLLSMSRKSIDDLTVSSISDVSSPSPNIIESQQNNPFIELQNVMNHYNLSFADIQNQLSKSTLSATKSDKNLSKSNTNAEMENLEGDSSPTSDDVDYSEILSKYQEVTRNCVEKISTLTLMIDKIRAEKVHILSPISVDLNENSMTSYLELPPGQQSQKCDCSQEKNCKNCTSTSNSLTQEEIDKYFLEILPQKKDVKDVKETFIPMLKGIPKYSNDPIVNQINFNPPKPRPPVSLAQNMQRYNLNIDMTPHELSTIVELDTATNSKNISEQRPKSPEDLMLMIPMRDSDEIDANKSKETSTLTSTFTSGFITISPEHEISTKKERRKSPRSKNTKTKSIKKNDNLQELSGMHLLSSLSDNTSSSSPENFENILRNMGLGWAISTLKKTQEALALSSSSSSDCSLRKHVNVSLNNTSTSDVTLKDVLNREFLKKISSSSTPSDSPNLQELQDISDIIGVTQNKDRSTQRTSTPVHQSKSTDSKNNLFASVSDISSVRQHSDENMFLSIPDVSLDTNRSLK